MSAYMQRMLAAGEPLRLFVTGGALADLDVLRPEAGTTPRGRGACGDVVVGANVGTAGVEEAPPLRRADAGSEVAPCVL